MRKRKQDEPPFIVQVVHDDEHVADLIAWGYNQPYTIFRISPLVEDLRKLRAALRQYVPMQSEGTVLRTTGRAMHSGEGRGSYVTISFSWHALVEIDRRAVAWRKRVAHWVRARRNVLTETVLRFVDGTDVVAEILFHTSDGMGFGSSVDKAEDELPQSSAPPAILDRAARATSLIRADTGETYDCGSYRLTVRPSYTAEMKWFPW